MKNHIKDYLINVSKQNYQQQLIDYWAYKGSSWGNPFNLRDLPGRNIKLQQQSPVYNVISSLIDTSVSVLSNMKVLYT